MARPTEETTQAQWALTLRAGRAEDAEQAGRVCFEAFARLAEAHGFPPDFPSPEAAIGVLSLLLSHPGFYSLVAEQEGRLVGSNFLDERSPIAGVGPITVDPELQNAGIGRRPMEAVLERARERSFAGVRLLQAAYHNRSLSLYAKLGFHVRELVANMAGQPAPLTVPGYMVRPATEEDLPACNEVCLRVHGHDRAGELADAIRQGSATLVGHDGKASAPFFHVTVPTTATAMKG